MPLKKIFKNIDAAYMNSLNRAGTIGLHMVSGVAVGGGIGYFLDQWLDTSPLLLIIFLILGILAGFNNVYKDTQRLIRDLEKHDV